MNFNHTDDRRMLGDTLARYLQQRYSIEVRHQISGSDAGWSRDQWTALAELGILGALFDGHANGFGGEGFDIGVVFEQLGKALVAEPFLGTLMGGRVLAKAGGYDALIEDVIAGTKLVAFAHEEPQSHYGVTDVGAGATHEGDHWLLTGKKAVVAQIAAADHVIVSARVADGDEGLGLFLVDSKAAGVSVQDYALIDGGRAGELTLVNAPASLIAPQALPLIEDAIAVGIVALVWEGVAIMDALKTATIEYLRTRKQFGVVIGQFQALQHRVASLSVEIEQARSAAINAAGALEGTRIDRERAVSAAKFTIGRVGTIVAEDVIQLHGGIGMTWELPLSHYAKRLIMIGHQLGDEDHHLARYTALRRAAV